MSTTLKKRIAYWFFLVLGMIGAIYSTYEFFTADTNFWGFISVVSLFSVFIFKPTILVDVFDLIKEKITR